MAPQLISISNKIKDILQHHNTFLYQLKQNVEIYKSVPSFTISLNDNEPANAATRTYNLPTIQIRMDRKK